MEKTINNEIQDVCQESIDMLEHIMDTVESLGLENEQFVLDWLDKINEISVRH